MPRPRYYCDYCDQSFHDTPYNRRRHLSLFSHQHLVRLHYNSYQYLSARNDADGNKAPCSEFARTGFCPFGTRCRFAHVVVSGGLADLNRVPLDQLPPSLRPPREDDDYDEVPIAEWG